MTGDQGFALHPGAAQDIIEIWEFVAGESPLAAERVRQGILDCIRKLIAFPEQGHKRPDLTSGPLRFRAIWEYLVVYHPAEKPLLVIAVLHGSRSPRIIAALLRARG